MDITPRRRLRFLTLLYGLTLIIIIVAADRGILVTRALAIQVLAALPAGDKIGHFVLMGLMSYLLNACLGGHQIRWQRYALLTGSAVVGALVTVEELSQLWMTHRSFDLADLAADFAGIWTFNRLPPLFGPSPTAKPLPSPSAPASDATLTLPRVLDRKDRLQQP